MLFLMFTPKIGEDEPNVTIQYFEGDGLVQPPTTVLVEWDWKIHRISVPEGGFLVGMFERRHVASVEMCVFP